MKTRWAIVAESNCSLLESQHEYSCTLRERVGDICVALVFASFLPIFLNHLGRGRWKSRPPSEETRCKKDEHVTPGPFSPSFLFVLKRPGRSFDSASLSTYSPILRLEDSFAMVTCCRTCLEGGKSHLIITQSIQGERIGKQPAKSASQPAS